MSWSDLLIGAFIALGLAAYAYDWRQSTPVVSATAFPPAPYAPQGLLWIDETLEQTTWWGDGAIIQSTH